MRDRTILSLLAPWHIGTDNDEIAIVLNFRQTCLVPLVLEPACWDTKRLFYLWQTCRISPGFVWTDGWFVALKLYEKGNGTRR